MNRDRIGILVASMTGCLTSIEFHLEEVTPRQYLQLEALYNQLLLIQHEVAGIYPKGAGAMYTSINFRTKKAFKDAVSAYNHQQSELRAGLLINAANTVPPITIYAPGIGEPKRDGTEFIEGPHFPLPHRWYAKVEMKDGKVVKVT